MLINTHQRTEIGKRQVLHPINSRLGHRAQRFEEVIPGDLTSHQKIQTFNVIEMWALGGQEHQLKLFRVLIDKGFNGQRRMRRSIVQDDEPKMIRVQIN